MPPESQKLDDVPSISKAETMQFAVLGDFELRREIGRGGMGTVYEAWQISLQRTVALKVLAAQVASTPKAVSRFRREAQAAAKLHHTHIVPIFAQGEALGSYFYAMEMIEGESLHAVIEALRIQHRAEPVTDQAETLVLPQRSGTSTVTKVMAGRQVSDSAVRRSGSAKREGFGTPEFFHEIARHLADVADALEYAHANGVVHRDIKPHNLLFGRDGRLRISDFGLARLAEQPGVTMTGEVLGSPLYMSPEQITGDPAGVDHRTDIYSLGATMYEWLTLTPPYPGETRERVISRILSSEPAHPRGENPSVPLDLETICLKAIDRNLDRRYQSAGEIRDDLRRFLLSRPISARRAGTATRAMRFLFRHQVAVLFTLALVLGSVLLAALWTKDRRVKVEQAEVTKAKAQVEQAKEAMSDLEIFKAAVNTVIPAGGVLAEMVASSDLTKTAIPKDLKKISPKIGTPPEIALRTVKSFYSSVADKDWPDEKRISKEGLELIDQARAKWAEGDDEGARDLINRYLTQLPGDDQDLEAVQMRAALDALLGKFDDMLVDANALLNAGTPNGYAWRALARLMLKEVKPSLRDLDSASLSDQGPQSLWIKLFKGLALLQLEKIAEAKGLFDDVLQEQPKSPGGYLGLGQTAHLGMAMALHAEGNYEAALPEVEQVLKTDAKNVHALTLRGEFRANMGDLEGSLKDFKEAIGVAGYLPELVARAVLVMQLRDNSAGEKALPEGTEVKSRHGTDPDDKSAPPVFKWLRQRLPENESGAMQPDSRLFQASRIRTGLPLSP